METYDPFDIAGQEVTQADKALTARLEQETEEADIKWLMSSRRGRRIVWRLLDQAGVFRTSFNTVAMQMAFNEGCRNYGLRMLALIETACPELYPLMNKEKKDGPSSQPKQ